MPTLFEREPRLTVDEQLLLRRSEDLASSRSRRRIRLSLFSSAVLCAAVASAGWAVPPWRPLAAVFVVYIAITSWERVTCGRSVLRYEALAGRLYQLLRDQDRRGGG